MVWGNYARAGKSYACQLNSKKTLFVTPYNQLCEELRKKEHQAITLHNLMSLRITGDSSRIDIMMSQSLVLLFLKRL